MGGINRHSSRNPLCGRGMLCGWREGLQVGWIRAFYMWIALYRPMWKQGSLDPTHTFFMVTNTRLKAVLNEVM
jgi:hypothetical protein